MQKKILSDLKITKVQIQKPECNFSGKKMELADSYFFEEVCLLCITNLQGISVF